MVKTINVMENGRHYQLVGIEKFLRNLYMTAVIKRELRIDIKDKIC